MLRLLAIALLLPWALCADDWVEYRYGSFEIWTDSGDREAREILNHLEQTRHVAGSAMGKPELKTLWPVRVLITRSARTVVPELARDVYIASLPPKTLPPADWTRELVRIFIEDGAGRMPADIESGLAAFFSTIQVDGTRVTVGAPPAAARRDLGWAKVHLLQTSPDYSGKLRVLLSNLQGGVDADASYKNAFGKTPAQIAQEAQAHLGAGNFSTWPANSKPLSAMRDFRPSYKAPNPAIAVADLKLVTRAADARSAYETLLTALPAVANEGLGLLALQAKQTEEARKRFAAAVEAGSTSARAHLEYARLEGSPAKRRLALDQAAKLNAAWPAPHAFRASIETDPLRKLQALEQAAKLAPRDSALWRQAAESYQALGRFGEASRAWAAAERAATTEQERGAVLAARKAIEDKRLEWEAAERRRQAEEREREMRLLREKAMQEVRAAEARANRGAPEAPSDRRVVPLFEGEAPKGRVRGKLVRIECMSPRARFTVESETGTVLKLMSNDPSKVVVFGEGEIRFDCGPLKPPRDAIVEYFPKEDPKTGTAGELASIEYTRAPGEAPDAPVQPPQRKKLGIK